MRSSGRVSVRMLRAWGVQDRAAHQAVRDLVTRSVAIKIGGKRYASYRLINDIGDLPLPELHSTPRSPDVRVRLGIEADLDIIIQALQAGHSTSRGLAAHLGMPVPNCPSPAARTGDPGTRRADPAKAALRT